MVLVVLVLGLALDLANAQFNLHIAVGKNYNMARISGVWHLVSMASDNMTYIEEKGDLRLFIRNIQFLNNSNLQFDFHIMIHGECVAVTVVCEKTKNSGEFSIAYEGENKVLLVETDYTMYAIFHMQNIKNGTRTQVLALYGRFMQIDETYQERFENICKLYGLGSQNIIDMTNKGRVPFSDAERPGEGSLPPGVACTGALRIAVGGQGGARQAI
eukprot:XP_008759844.1 PREDICTED: epididymal-specific lipocalin-9 isoform X1 [Rattus norvegicus]